jgi:hypothetical protein
MEERSPGYKTELEVIRRLLQQDPEQLQLLDPEKDISVIFAGMAMYKQIEIPESAKKKDKEKILPKGKAIGTEDF